MHCEVIITDYFFPRAELSVDQQQGLIRSTSKNVLNALIVSNLDFWLCTYVLQQNEKKWLILKNPSLTKNVSLAWVLKVF